MNNSLISIIIPTYNRIPLLLETITSVNKQTYQNWECLLIDDGTEPEHLKQIKVSIEKDKRFRLIIRTDSLPKGANSCRNLGTTEAIGDFILFLDSDDLLMPHCLEQRLATFELNPDFDFLVFQTQLFDHVPGDSQKIYNVLIKPLDDLNRFISFDYPWHTCAAIFNKNALLQSKVNWDESLQCHQDLDFYIHLLSKQPTYTKIEGKPDVYIRMGGESKVSHQNHTDSHLQSKVIFITNIKRYIKTSALPNKNDLLKRLYALSIFNVQWFEITMHKRYLKQIAKVNGIFYWTFYLDAMYYTLNSKASKRLKDYVFLNFYGLSGVVKRLKHLPFNTTLAYYKLREVPYAHLKVVHVASTLSGGAGIAAFRLHEGLMSLGVPSQMLALDATTNHNLHLTKFKKAKPTRFEKIWRQLFKASNLKQQQETIISLPANYELFTFAQTPYAVHEHPLIKEADLIHLHWVAGFIDVLSFFKHIHKPIVWTLHDMQPFQGGFHYRNDEDLNRINLGDLDTLQYQIKEKAYKKASISRIVAPSPWILNASKASTLLGSFPHQHIYYGIDDSVFTIRDKAKARQQFHLPIDKTMLLFVSETVNNLRKGFDILLESLYSLKCHEDFILVAIGEPPKERHPDIRYLGSISDNLTLSHLYSAADLYVLPSREDNLPNVMLEALLCGTPVIATPVGGMVSVIQDGFNGYLSTSLSVDAFGAAIVLGIDHLIDFNAADIREDAVNRFALHQQAKTYVELYETVLTEDKLMN